MMTLYQLEISPFCDKIRRALNWKRLPYQVKDIGVLHAMTGYKKTNPIGKVPCLEHDGQFIADSTDIAYYLEERFPERPLLPRDAAGRGLCHMLEDWADESLYFYEMRLRFTMPHNAKKWVPAVLRGDNAAFRAIGRFAVPRSLKGTLLKQGLGRKPEAMMLRDVARHVEAIAGHLGEREWLVGDALTLADLGVFAQMFCIRGADEGAVLIDAHKRVAAWMERVDKATAPVAA